MGRVIAGAVAGLVALIVLIAMAAAGAVSSLFADPAGGGGPLCLGIVNDDSQNAAPAGLTPEQTGNAAIIISVGQQWEVPQRGWVIAIATALQESNLINLGDLGADNDHDSLGLFQQRPSMGWGSPELGLSLRCRAGQRRVGRSQEGQRDVGGPAGCRARGPVGVLLPIRPSYWRGREGLARAAGGTAGPEAAHRWCRPHLLRGHRRVG